MTGPTQAHYEVSSSPSSVRLESLLPPASNEGISNNQFSRLCGTGKRQLREIRNDRERLAAFTTERLGKPYEYRDGAFYPILAAPGDPNPKSTPTRECILIDDVP